MAKLTVDLGSVIANGADGDTAREAFTKVNSNFTEVYDNLQNQSGNLDTKVDKVAGKSLVDDTEIAKLATVQANATQNSSDAYLLDRTNHTGTQAISTVSGLQTALEAKVDEALLGTAAFEDASSFEKILTQGQGITIDRTNPASPIISVGGAGTGDVLGPNISTNNGVALFDGTTGKLLMSGGVLGTAAFTSSTDYATSVQGGKADSALQPNTIGTTVQGYSENLTAWSEVTTASKQDTLVSNTNIKTINGQTLLGSGDITINDSQNLEALSGLIGAGGKFPAFTGVGTMRAADIVGTVSQSEGVPTGAIIERGSNANGEYVRYVDGTQICWAESSTLYTTSDTDGALFFSNGATFTYPAVFAEGTKIIVSPANLRVSQTNLGFSYSGSMSGVSVGGYSTRSTSSFYPAYFAIGRWFQ